MFEWECDVCPHRIPIFSFSMSPKALLQKYCKDNEALFQILYTHSSQVASKCMQILYKHPEYDVDRDFIYNAALLHDIGVVRVNAPGIHCYGDQPYICHGLLGAEILKKEGLPQYAGVAARHTGTGITAAQIIARKLPLPVADYVPQTLEEQIVCYADKFFSKTHVEDEKSIAQVRKSLEKFGSESVDQFDQWVTRFE